MHAFKIIGLITLNHWRRTGTNFFDFYIDCYIHKPEFIYLYCHWQVGITLTRTKLDSKSCINCTVLLSTNSDSSPSLLMLTTFSVSQVCILWLKLLLSAYRHSVFCKYEYVITLHSAHSYGSSRFGITYVGYSQYNKIKRNARYKSEVFSARWNAESRCVETAGDCSKHQDANSWTRVVRTPCVFVGRRLDGVDVERKL